MASKKSAPEGIAEDKTYRVCDFLHHSGIGESTFEEFRKEGLRVLKIGRMVFMEGSEWRRFLRDQANGNGHK